MDALIPLKRHLPSLFAHFLLHSIIMIMHCRQRHGFFFKLASLLIHKHVDRGCSVISTPEKTLYILRLRENRDLLADERLVVRLNDKYVSWTAAAPVILSVALFKVKTP